MLKMVVPEADFGSKAAVCTYRRTPCDKCQQRIDAALSWKRRNCRWRAAVRLVQFEKTPKWDYDSSEDLSSE